MGYFAESFAELYNADGWIDMGMYIGAGSSAYPAITAFIAPHSEWPSIIRTGVLRWYMP